MKLLPRYVTVVGVVVAVAAVLMDESLFPFLTQLFGTHAATKLAALGAIVAALGRALIPPTDEKIPPAEKPPR